MTITTEMLKEAGCFINAYVAYDIDIKPVARRRYKTDDQWKLVFWERPRRFRLKAGAA